MRTVVVGAGLAGLMAGRALQDAGHEVVLLDKGRSPGGRLATRRIGEARLDHGAQFFTVRTDEFARHVDAWRDAGLVTEWCRGFTPEGDGFPRYVVRDGMNALAKHLAQGLDVRCSTLVFAVRPGDGNWNVALDDGTSVPADALIVTCPLPQAFAVLVSSGVELPEDLRSAEYDRTLSLLAVLDRPAAVPFPGGVQNADETFSFIADNTAKGVSTVPAITFHTNPAWSEEHWSTDRHVVDAELCRLAAPWLGDAHILEHQVKRWRFATPRTIWAEPCWRSDVGVAPVVLAGDAFAGPRVEGAAVSGLAAARSLLG